MRCSGVRKLTKHFYLRATISAALALGPIYWFPSISFLVMFAARAALLFAIFLLSFSKSVRLRSDILLASIFLLAASVFSSIFHADNFFMSVLPAILLLFIGSQIAAKLDFSEFRVAIYAAVNIFSLFCCVVLLDFILGGVITDPFYTAYAVYLHESGFNGGRTAWGYASNLFLALALQHALTQPREKSLTQNMNILVIFIIFANIVITGARGAFLVSMMLILLYLLLSIGRRKFFPIIALVFTSVLLSFIVFGYDALSETRLVTTFFLADSRDLSTANYRIETYHLAFEAIGVNPFFGAGSIAIDTGREVLHVHSVWLRFAAERGVLYLIVLTVYLGAISIISIKSARLNEYELRLLLVAGVLTGFVEPSAVFGNYFVSSLFWIIIGFFLNPLVCSQKNNCRERLSLQSQSQ